ncbi:hypothetical protein DY000_02027178 [Brassica cretica]|uniref:Uncharacterized protein n=1 Tax=Brassica cretica TaxID=69181 RepID=A0ABQ7EGW7_BRACR|nr:hypothetical protein DY000_02027178 [Brassica cretica]
MPHPYCSRSHQGCHSRAATTAFITIDRAVTDLFSNKSRFCDVQIPQRIQGERLLEIPVGGKHHRVDMNAKQSWSEVDVAKSGTEWKGARFHTCLAKGQRKNICRAVSG